MTKPAVRHAQPAQQSRIGPALRDRCTELLEEVRGAATDDAAIDSMVEVLTTLQAAKLTADDRRGLAAIYGYELGRSETIGEGALEVENIRRLLVKHGVPDADGHGELRSTIAMLEDALVASPPR